MKPTPPSHDEIVAEIHEIRAKIAEKFNYDIAAIAEDARKRQEASGRPLWQGRRAEKTPTPPPASSCDE